MAKKKQYPNVPDHSKEDPILKIVAKGFSYKFPIKAMTPEGDFVVRKNPDGSPIKVKNIYGIYEDQVELKIISFHPFEKYDQNHYSMVIIFPPKNKQEEYELEILREEIENGRFMTEEQYREMKDPTLKQVNDLRREKTSINEEKSTLQKQLAEARAKIAQFEGKK